MIVCFFSFAEVRSGRMSSYDPRSWGICQRVICFFSLRQTWLAYARFDCDAWDAGFSFGSFCQDCWHHVELILEWNGCFLSYDCFLVHFGDYVPTNFCSQPVAVTGRRHLHHRPVDANQLCYFVLFTQPVAATGRRHLRPRPVVSIHPCLIIT